MRSFHLALLFTILFTSQVSGSLLDGLEHHGDHGHHGDHAHGDHGDHAHGEHAHGEHGDHSHGEHGDHAHGEHAHGEHGDPAHGEHAHGDHGDHAHEEHGDHANGEHGTHDHGEEHNHDHDNTANTQDPFVNALASDLSGGILSNLPATSAPAQPEKLSIPAVAPSEEFLAPLPAAAPVQNAVAFQPIETTEYSVTPTPRAETFVDEQELARENTNQFIERQESSGSPKQLVTANVATGNTGEYPEYAAVPRTTFSCADQQTGGYFADPEAQCQVFHICLNGLNLGSFLCPNGTLFHQQYFVCDWWFNVDCGASASSYGLNARIGVVPDSADLV